MKYFSYDEFKCKETGENKIKPDFVARLDLLREACGFPFVITSGYRSPSHSAEKAKEKPGFHAQGIAADIAVKNGIERGKIVRAAIDLGFTGIGVASDFIHVDTRDGELVLWGY